MTRDEFARRTSGTFTMTGRFTDAGTVTTSYRYAGRNIDGTARLTGTRGIFTIGLVGTRGRVAHGTAGAGRAGKARRVVRPSGARPGGPPSGTLGVSCSPQRRMRDDRRASPH
jgi:hypothetical protein